MITRIFRVNIDSSLREEFESKFASTSVDAVQNAKGSISVQIGKPTEWAPNEYVMVSEWENIEALKDFAGENWSEAHIPAGMEKFVRECWTHHYVPFDNA